MNIAVFLPNWIGDAVMATPALRALRERFSDATMTAVMRPYVADVLAGLDLVDDQLLHNPRGRNREQRGWRFVRELRSRRFDLSVLFPNSLHSAILARLSGAKQRVGMNRDGRGFLLTDRVAPKPKSAPHPALDEYLRLAAHLGCTNLSHRMELATTPEDERRFQAFCERRLATKWCLTPSCDSNYVCLNPGGAFGAAKHWPSESFAALARRIVDVLDRNVLVLCGPAERGIAREIVNRAERERVVSFADEELSIGLTKAAVRHAELLATTDSGPRHFAPPFGVPVVSIFGPTHIAWSDTHYENEIHLQLKVDCGPCQQRVCPLGHHKCMRDLSPGRVFDAVARLIDDVDSDSIHRQRRRA